MQDDIDLRVAPSRDAADNPAIRPVIEDMERDVAAGRRAGGNRGRDDEDEREITRIKGGADGDAIAACNRGVHQAAMAVLRLASMASRKPRVDSHF